MEERSSSYGRDVRRGGNRGSCGRLTTRCVVHTCYGCLVDRDGLLRQVPPLKVFEGALVSGFSEPSRMFLSVFFLSFFPRNVARRCRRGLAATCDISLWFVRPSFPSERGYRSSRARRTTLRTVFCVTCFFFSFSRDCLRSCPVGGDANKRIGNPPLPLPSLETGCCSCGLTFGSFSIEDRNIRRQSGHTMGLVGFRDTWRVVSCGVVRF